jgi:hypothetical protein
MNRNLLVLYVDLCDCVKCENFVYGSITFSGGVAYRLYWIASQRF